MTYAQNTRVSIDRTRSEIERTLQRFGASEFVSGWRAGIAVIGFTIGTRCVRMELLLPQRHEYNMTPSGRHRPAEAIDKAWNTACRERWRGLLLLIKAKLVAVEQGLHTVEEEFLSWTVVPGDGRTVGQIVQPQLECGSPPELLRLTLDE